MKHGKSKTKKINKKTVVCTMHFVDEFVPKTEVVEFNLMIKIISIDHAG